MRKLFAAIAFLGLTGMAFGQSQAQTFMFTGKLISTPASTGDCGTMANAYAYEFEVGMISDGSYTDQNIAIIVKCPELYGADFFKVGTTYKIELSDQMGSTTYGIVNNSVLNNYNLPYNYWAGDMKRISN